MIHSYLHVHTFCQTGLDSVHTRPTRHCSNRNSIAIFCFRDWREERYFHYGFRRL